MRYQKFHVSSILSLLLAGLLIGLIIYRFTPVNSTSFLGLLVFSPLLIKKSYLSLLIAFLVGASIGFYRGEVVSRDVHRFENRYGTEVSVIGIVADDTSYTDRGQTEFHLENLLLNGEQIRGRVRVRAYRAIGINRGDRVRANGNIYPALGNRQGSIGFADVEILASGENSLEQIRSRFFAGVNTALPEPNASLGLGFLVGLRALLPDQLLEELSRTGLTHIVAVSGYNLTILVRLTRRLFSRLSAFVSVAVSGVLISGFLLVTGFTPSISRAAVVSGFALLSWYYGRRVPPLMLILLGAAVTGVINPFFVWYDLGWWLSFAAFTGVLLLAPLIAASTSKKEPGLFKQILIETTSAQIMALPIIVFVFEELSIISLIANLIILPLIPLAMLLTFIAGIGGVFGPFVAGWLSWPANILLTFITDMVSVMSRLPWALAEISISVQQLASIYAIVLLTGVFLFKKQGRKALKKSHIE